MYWTNNQRLSFFSVLFLLLYFIKEILSLGIRTDITMETKDTIYVIELEKIGMNFMIDEDKTIVLGKIVPLVAEPLLPGLVKVWGVATEKMS